MRHCAALPGSVLSRRSTSPRRRDAASPPRHLTARARPCFRFGVVSWDQTLRNYVGGLLARLFPHLPDRGQGKWKILGIDRSFAHSLKFTVSNPRKTMNMNGNYKRRLVVPRAALCPKAANLIETKSYPIKVESGDSANLGSFERGVLDGVSSFTSRDGARAWIQILAPHCYLLRSYCVVTRELLIGCARLGREDGR